MWPTQPMLTLDVLYIPAAAVQHDAHNLRTPKHRSIQPAVMFNTTRARARTHFGPKHRSRYHSGRRCGRHNLYKHRPLIGEAVGEEQEEAPF